MIRELVALDTEALALALALALAPPTHFMTGFSAKLHIRKTERGSVGVLNLIPLPKREPRRATRHEG